MYRVLSALIDRYVPAQNRLTAHLWLDRLLLIAALAIIGLPVVWFFIWIGDTAGKWRVAQYEPATVLSSNDIPSDTHATMALRVKTSSGEEFLVRTQQGHHFRLPGETLCIEILVNTENAARRARIANEGPDRCATD